MYGAGIVVAGKYRIERVLGQGGMGYVVAATHLDLGTPVALKFLHEHMLENQSLVDRFKREARSSAQLRGENICRVSDVGTAENGQPYIVMELLSGQDLTSVLKERGPLPVPMVADIVQQACLALAEAHALGIVHRDLKPGNLMMTMRPDGTMCIKVLDFGVAKGPEDINFSLTQTASVIGSPGYMSPEQLKSSKTADVRSDIWSLGVVMYELVSGIKPFQGESITELALKVAMDPMPPLGGVVPWYFEQVITRCLEKEAARRYADVADLAVALAPFAGTRGHEMAHGVARVLRGAHTPLPVPPSATLSPPSPTPAPASAPVANNPTTLRGASGMVTGPPTVTVRRNWKLPVILGGGAVLGVALALLVVRGHKQEKRAASSESQASSTPAAATPMPTPTSPQVPVAPTPTPPAPDGAAKAKEEAEAKEQAAKDEAAKAAAAKKEDELAKKEAAKQAAKQAAASAAAEKAELAKAEAAKKQAAREAAAKAAAQKKEQELAKRQAAREAAARAAAAKAEAKKTASSSKTTKTSTTKTSTQSKDLGDSRF